MVKTLRWNWRVAVSNCTGGLNRDEHRIKCNDRHGFGVFHLTLAQNLLHGSQTVDKTTPLTGRRYSSQHRQHSAVYLVDYSQNHVAVNDSMKNDLMPLSECGSHT